MRVIRSDGTFCGGKLITLALMAFITPPVANVADNPSEVRPRARDLGLKIGVLPPGPWNAITDVPGIKVGHATLSRGSDIRTGVTVIVPHDGNLFQQKVPGAVYIGNAFGKLI